MNGVADGEGARYRSAVLPGLLLSLVVAGPADDATWRYEVRLTHGADVLEVDARFPPGVSAELSVDDAAVPYLHDVAVDAVGGAKRVAAKGTSWWVPQCKTGCTIHYAFDLGRYADAMGQADEAERDGTMLVSSPASWMLRPADGAGTSPLRLHVAAPAGVRFAVGWPRGAEPDTYVAHADDIDLAPYAAFGSMELRSVPVGQQTVEIAYAPLERRESKEVIARWIQSCAEAVRRYAGSFPIDHTLVLVLPGDGDAVNGRALGAGGATVLLWLGPDATEAKMHHEWVLVHELTHLLLPSVRRDHHWLEEGLATYVEPLARLRTGELKPPEVWSQLAWGLPQGLPGRRDEGLDQTPTWGRTYWGGALFWFAADVRIRQRTQNRCSIQDAIRGIDAAGGNMGERWPIENVLRAADRAVGGTELEAVYGEMNAPHASFDLKGLFRSLGVARDGTPSGNDAPLAWVRDGITDLTPTRCGTGDGGR